MRELLEYLFIIAVFFLFLVWCAIMREPPRHEGLFPQVPLTSGEYN